MPLGTTSFVRIRRLNDRQFVGKSYRLECLNRRSPFGEHRHRGFEKRAKRYRSSFAHAAHPFHQFFNALPVSGRGGGHRHAEQPLQMRCIDDFSGAVADTANIVNMHFPLNMTKINREVKFVTTQELEDLYPDKTPSSREQSGPSFFS